MFLMPGMRLLGMIRMLRAEGLKICYGWVMDHKNFFFGNAY